MNGKQVQESVRKARWYEYALAFGGTVLAVGVLALLLLPSLSSVAAVGVVEDRQTLSIGATAEVEPDEGWSAQPASRDGVLLRSPDRLFEVTLRPSIPDDQLEGDLLVETLSNGAELSHVTVERDTTAMLWLPDGGGSILVEATVDDRANPGNYRAELAGLLLHVKPLR